VPGVPGCPELQKILSRASRVSLSPDPPSLSLSRARERESVEREKKAAGRGRGRGREEGERNDCTAQKFAINFWRARWCRVGVIGFAENFYVFSRHLHNVRGEHGPIDRLI